MMKLLPSLILLHTASAFVQTARTKVGTTRLFGWGPDPVWDAAEVVSVATEPNHQGCVSVVLNVGEEKAPTYAIPGQYCQVKECSDDAKPAFLAVASPPTEASSEWEFLIKRTENNGWICDAAAGTKLDVSQILGQGFQMEENLDGFKYDFPTQQVLMFAAGSGIAPIRAAIESGQLKIGKGRAARLYYGCRSLNEMAYADRFQQWEQLGVQVVPVLSQEAELAQPFRGGYVQTALEEDGVPVPRNCGALICGMKGMAESVTDLLKKSGMFEDRILTNF